MKKSLAIKLVALAGLFTIPCIGVAADEYFVFKVSATLPLTHVVLGAGSDKVTTKTLSGNDLVNLALGRALGTPLTKDKEILVLGFTFAGPLDAEQRPTTPPLVKLMIYDKTAIGAARKVQEIATITSMDYQEAFVGAGHKGQGICAGNVLETPAVVPPPGDPAKHKIFAAPFTGAATVTQGAGGFNSVDNFSLTAKSISMRLKVMFTDKNNVLNTIDGYVVKGTFKTSGKRIDTYTE